MYFLTNEDKEKIAEEIIEKVLEGYEKGVLTRREMKMITNIFEYMDSDAKDIMTHRKNIVALDGEESLEKALIFMLEENKSRFPVYEEDIDNIVGILHIRDAMQSYLDGPARKKPVHDLKDAIRPAGFIPETKAIDKLFQQMQQDKSHMVIVLDEYGQTSGIVTMEDIVEEIVGNIQDEYDEEEELIIKQADGTYIVDGMTQLEDLEELLGISFNEEDYDTINGLSDRLPGQKFLRKMKNVRWNSEAICSMYCQLIIIQYAKSLSVGQKSDKIVQLRIVKILKRGKK